MGSFIQFFSKDDSLEIMETCQVFLLSVFDSVARTHLCSKVGHNQIMALFGGKATFYMYVRVNPDKFFSTLSNKLLTTIILSFYSIKSTKMNIPNCMLTCWTRFTPELDPISEILINVP